MEPMPDWPIVKRSTLATAAGFFSTDAASCSMDGLTHQPSGSFGSFTDADAKDVEAPTRSTGDGKRIPACSGCAGVGVAALTGAGAACTPFAGCISGVTAAVWLGLPRTDGLMNAGDVGMLSEVAGALVDALVEGNGVCITRPGSR